MEGKPKHLPRAIATGLLAALAQMAPPATFYSGRAGGGRSRRGKKNPPGHKLAKRVKMMCGGR